MIRPRSQHVIRIVSAAAALALASLAAPHHARAGATKPPANALPSTAVTDEILDAVAEEMERARTSLEIPGAPRPYFIAYKITEVEVNDVVASLGAITTTRERHVVTIEAHVHVGDYDLDNRNFVIAGAESVDGVATFPLPLEATPRIARRGAWLVTDQAYKEALGQLLAKKEARRTGGIGRSPVPSFTTEQPLVKEDDVLVPALESAAELEKRAQAISSVFRDQELIRDSRVAFTSFLERRWYINSEGTSAHDTRRVSGVIVAAQGQADDGQDILQYWSKYGITGRDLPGDDALIGEAKAVLANVLALRDAPWMDRYVGPVLFEGAGAGGVIRETLAPHLGGTPLPEGLTPAEVKTFGGALTDKIGLRVLAPTLSIVDDPTTKEWDKQAMIGGYAIDDEGIAPQKVAVVKDGTLIAMLTSRTPSEKDATSNGHARRTAPGGIFHGSATNLILSAKKGLAHKALVKKLLEEAKAQGKPYALIVRRFDDPAVTSSPDLTKREMVQLYKSADVEMPPPVLLAYKVYPDGKEELVRGAQFRPISIDAWKDVVAAGNTYTIFNFLANSAPYVEQKIGGAEGGAVPSSGIESAIATPDLLFKQLVVVGSNSGLRDPPAVPRPGSAAAPAK
jgi:TldD protein